MPLAGKWRVGDNRVAVPRPTFPDLAADTHTDAHVGAGRRVRGSCAQTEKGPPPQPEAL